MCVMSKFETFRGDCTIFFVIFNLAVGCDFRTSGNVSEGIGVSNVKCTDTGGFGGRVGDAAVGVEGGGVG